MKTLKFELITDAKTFSTHVSNHCFLILTHRITDYNLPAVVFVISIQCIVIKSAKCAFPVKLLSDYLKLMYVKCS